LYYSTHLIAGDTVGYLTGDPIVGFVAGTVSHALLDMVPHHDFKRIRFCIVDILSGSLLFLLFLLYGQPEVGMIAGAIGGIWPDIEIPLYYFDYIKKKYFPSHSGLIKHRQASFAPGVLVQVAVAVTGIWIMS